MIINLAADCLISLKFVKDFDHVSFDPQQTFKVKGSKVKVTARRNAGENVVNYE